MKVVFAAALLAATTGALDTTDFRYVRELQAEPGPVLVEPDGRLHEHARTGFADLRILDARGRQVPWREAPPPDVPRTMPVQLLNQGRQDGKAVALIDLGPDRRVHDRVQLSIPDRRFVGSVEVLGSDDRNTFTRLSRTPIYSVRGARNARSTLAVFPPTDFRYLQLRATGVTSIDEATVAYDPSRPPLDPVRAQSTVRQRPRSTIVELDLGFRDVPVHELVVMTSTRRFDRPIVVRASNGGGRFVPIGDGRVTRFSGVSLTSVFLDARHRYLRVEIENGDDPPLAGLRVQALARPQTLLLQGGFEPPYRLYYGDPGRGAPEYDFAELPASETGLARAQEAQLGAEVSNPDFEPPEDTRSFAARHPVLLQAVLALAAIAVAAGGFLALRRKT